MDNQDKLIDDVEVIAKKIKELHDLAYVRGTTTLSEDLQEYLSNAVFDPLRMRDDFCALLR